MHMASEKKRVCGECTLCCFVFEVKTEDGVLTKPQEWCKNCAVGSGCKVFKTTIPAVCPQWDCAWLEGMGTDEERPDRTQVVMHWRLGKLGRTLEMLEGTPEALSSEYAQRVTYEFVVRRRVPVIHFRASGKQQYMVLDSVGFSEKEKTEFEKAGVEIAFLPEQTQVA